jgi:DNA oxidative demethylase
MDLFTDPNDQRLNIAEGAYWLRGFALPVADTLWAILLAHFKQHPPQTMMTPMGYPMSVKTTSVGDYGWVGATEGYGYTKINPNTQQAWPAMPDAFLSLAQQAAQQAGYADFSPDTCLVNVYAIGTKMGLHQDKDELDFTQPIVSVSLGIPATFLFGGAKRTDKTMKIPLTHGDVVVWGGASRRFYHGINTIKPNRHALLRELRCNLTFRKAR